MLRAARTGAPAGQPAADDHIHGPDVADLDPGARTHTGLVHRVQPLADQPFQAALPGRLERTRPVPHERPGRRPVRSGQPELLQPGPAARIGKRSEVTPKEHQVEQHEVHGSVCRTARRQRGGVGQSHTGLQPLEVAVPPLVRRHHLAVQYGGCRTQGLAQRAEFRIGAGDDLARPGAQLEGAVAREVDHRPLAVLLRLVGPLVVLPRGRQDTGGGQHGGDQRQSHGSVVDASARPHACRPGDFP